MRAVISTLMNAAVIFVQTEELLRLNCLLYSFLFLFLLLGIKSRIWHALLSRLRTSNSINFIAWSNKIEAISITYLSRLWKFICLYPKLFEQIIYSLHLLATLTVYSCCAKGAPAQFPSTWISCQNYYWKRWTYGNCGWPQSFYWIVE